MKEQTRLGLGVLEAALLLGLLADALLRADSLGLNLFLWVGALVAAMAALMRKKGVRLGREGRWLLPCVLLFAASCAWRDAVPLRLLDFLAISTTLALAAWRVRGGHVQLAGLTEYALAGVVSSVNAAFGGFLLLFSDIEWKEIPRTGLTRHVWAVLRGLAIAVPLVLLFGALFMAADTVYEGIMRSTFNIDAGAMFSHAFVFTFFAWVSAGFLRGMFSGKEPLNSPGEPAVLNTLGLTRTGDEAKGRATASNVKDETVAGVKSVVDDESISAGQTKSGVVETKVKNDASAPSSSARRLVSLGIVEVGVVVGLLDVLFFSFVVVQLRYFFGGASVVLNSAGLTYAEYARRGFFELVWVAALVLPLLLAAHWLLRKENPVHERIFRGLAGAQLLLLFVIMASAVGRMRLYQSEYGQTELRLYVTAFMGWLALVFVWFALTVLRGERERFACGALVAALLIAGALHAINPSDMIVRTNAALALEIRRFDAAYATSLGADAVPALIEALPSLRPRDRRYVSATLLRWTEKQSDWRTWNWSRSHARRAVLDNEALLREWAIQPNSLGEGQTPEDDARQPPQE
ncbi:MAG: DUF4173 domain-containing protein [Acidobacteria bacterium]|nr:DUF4173 domain-containing protein [Acidobacteriota bacterium]